MIGSHIRLVGIMVLILLPFFMEGSIAQLSGGVQVVYNVQIYLGVLPAEMIQGVHPEIHTEGTMHGGVPNGRGDYHVMVALFDAVSGERIRDADVRARVSEIGLVGPEKQLQPMEIVETETYGNYFAMSGNGPFRISLTMHILGRPDAISAQFEHQHQYSNA